MSTALASRVVKGVQAPRLKWMPEGDLDWSLGEKAVKWAKTVLGVELDEWQKLLLRMMLARLPDGKWACREFAVVISRQNGKSLVLLIRCLFGLIELDERDVVFSAHLGDTVRGIFQLAQKLLDDAKKPTPPYHPYNSDGRERLQFDDGRALRFKTRTKAGGRGLGGDVLVLDEAQELRDEHMDALTPILGARTMTGNPQILYSGSAGDFESTVFARVRRRGIAGGSARLGFTEWSIDVEAYLAADTFQRERMVSDPVSMAVANPTLNVVRRDGTGGIAEDFLVGQIDTLSPAGFAREHLGVGTWPTDDSHDWVIPRVPWREQADPEAVLPAGSLVFGLSASWGDRSVTIAAAGSAGEGCYGWLERQDRGTSWVVPDVVRLASSNPTAAVVLDARGPAGPLADPLEQALKPLGVPLHRLTGRDVGYACGGLSDAVTADPPGFAHRGQPEVDAALAGTKRKDIGDGLWVFDRKRSMSDIAPLEAVTLARYGWVLYGQDDDSFNIW